MKNQRHIVIDQEQRFSAGQQVEISTDMGRVPAKVVEAYQITEGWLYKVHYVPLWDKSGVGGFTVVTGRAVSLGKDS